MIRAALPFILGGVALACGSQSAAKPDVCADAEERLGKRVCVHEPEKDLEIVDVYPIDEKVAPAAGEKFPAFFNSRPRNTRRW